ncbi:MAG: PDZ domain-containing protein, partial [Pirellulales bacterium]
MEIDPNIPSYTNWLFGGPDTSAAIVMFGGVVLVVSLLALFIGWLSAVFRHGPGRGTALVGGSVSGGLNDLIRISPRRIYGLAWLAAREAFRRRIWVVLVIFALILMFAGWFLNPNTDSPAQLYLSFVLTSTTFLVLLLALFLSVFSLPNDIKNKTIYTVASKPVRASEIVLGRVLGFSAVGTLFLLAMAAASYLFVATSLRHTHELLDEDLIAVREQGEIVAYTGLTSNEKNHRHEVTIDLRDFSPGLTVGEAADDGGLRIDYVGYSAADAGIRVGDVLLEVDGKSVESGAATESLLLGMAGSEVAVKIARDGQPQEHTLQRVIANFETGSARDHTHPITAEWEGEGKFRYIVGREQGMLNARVPMWGQLRFRNPQGDAADSSSWQFDQRGINVGKMWTYRSYIRGNTLAAAIWTFDDVSETEYPDGLPLDMDIRVFRGHKGD